MKRSLARALAVGCSIPAVLGLVLAVALHLLRAGVELHYELDALADALALAVREDRDGATLEPDPDLRARLEAVPELRLLVVEPPGRTLLAWGLGPDATDGAGFLRYLVEQAAEGHIDVRPADRPAARYAYVTTRRTAGGRTVRIAADRAPAGLRDRLVWMRTEICSEYGPFLLVTMLVSIVVVLLTVRRALRPLERLSAEAAGIVPGNGRTLAVDRVPAEVVPLVNAMNGALERLQQGIARERRFTADLAHTLRTPLAALRARVEGLPEGLDRSAFLRAVGRIERLAEQLLLKARLEAGALDERTTFDLAELVREIAADAAPLLLRQDKTLVVQAPDRPVPRTGSRAAIERALLNLVDNAAKAAPPGSEVEIRVEEDGTVLVCDRGPGFAEGEAELLLQPFRRGTTSRWQGAGLGLAIVAEAVRRQGGAPILRNRPGGGAEVGFELPAHGPDLAVGDRKLAA